MAASTTPDGCSWMTKCCRNTLWSSSSTGCSHSTLFLTSISSSSRGCSAKKFRKIRSRIELFLLKYNALSTSHVIVSGTGRCEDPSSSIPAGKLVRRGRTPSFQSLLPKRSLRRRIMLASDELRSIFLLNAIALVNASNIPVLKEVEGIMDPAAFAVARFGVSAIPFIPYVLARVDAATLKAGMELGMWLSLGYLMQSLGLVTSEAGRSSFISIFTVMVVPLLDGMLGATVPAPTWFGALMSVMGVAMLESSGSPPCIGDLLTFLSALFFGVHMLRTEHISRRTKKENFLPLLGCELCAIAFVSMVWYFVEGWLNGTQSWNPQLWTWTLLLDSFISFPWIPALYTGLFSTGFCSWVEMVAMRDISATEAAVIYGLEPVWGAAFAWALLGERWGMTGWIGAAFVLGGSLTAQIYGSLPARETEERFFTRKDDRHPGLDEQSGLSASPIIVRSRKISNNVIQK